MFVVQICLGHGWRKTVWRQVPGTFKTISAAEEKALAVWSLPSRVIDSKGHVVACLNPIVERGTR